MADSSSSAKRSRFDAPKLNHGLNLVYEPSKDGKADSEASVDIIAVGGLGAEPETTWTYRKDSVTINWLRDANMLPAACKEARIMEFHYASSYYGEGAVSQTLLPIAQVLLAELKRVRKKCNRRPIIFVAHCLGGIIVEKAICHAKARLDEWSVVYTAVAGAIFLSTPFLGTASQKKGVLLAGLLEKIGQGLQSPLLSVLEWQNEQLKELRVEFLRIIMETSMMVYCFYELYPAQLDRFLPKLWRPNFQATKELIVVKDSATLDPHPSMPLEADHYNINKFSGPKDGRYLSVQDQMGVMLLKSRKLIKGRVQKVQRLVVSEGDYEGIRRELSVSDPDVTFDSIVQSNPAMFRKDDQISAISSAFLFTTEQYKTWKTSPASQALWVHGPTGTGKTFFAVEMVRQLRHELETQSKASEIDTLLTYVFCDGLSENTSLAVNIVKTVLKQIIVQNRELAKHVLASEKSKKDPSSSGYLTATVPALLNHMQNICRDGSVSVVYIIIDGLEKTINGPTRQEFLTGLSQMIKLSITHTSDSQSIMSNATDTQQLDSDTVIKWLFMSQDYDDVTDSLSLSGVTQVDLDSETNRSLVNKGKNFEFSQRLAALAVRQGYSPSLEYLVKTYVKTKAVSESVWVTLACGELEAREIPHTEVRMLLEEFPQGGNQMFHYAFQRVLDKQRENIEVVKEIFRCLLVAVESPSMAELAVIIGLRDAESHDRGLLMRYITACAPFLVVDKSDIVRFVVPEVFDLFKNFGRDILYPVASSFKLQHGLVSLRCFEFVLATLVSKPAQIESEEPVDVDVDATQDAQNVEAAQQDNEGDLSNELLTEANDAQVLSLPKDTVGIVVSDDAVDVAYPRKYWLEHAKQAEDDLVDSLDFDKAFWQLSSNVREKWWLSYTQQHDEYADLTGMTSLHLASFFGFLTLLRYLLERGHADEITQEDTWGNQPLYWACRNDHLECVEELLKAGAQVDARSATVKRGVTAMHGAADGGHLRIVQRLSKHDADVNTSNYYRGTPLFIASVQGHTDVVEFLLHAGADVNLADDFDTMPLQGAVHTGKLELVQMLLQHGSVVEPPENYKRTTPLVEACRHGFRDIAELLINHGGDVNRKSHEYNSPLASAAEGSRFDTFLLLLNLDNGPDEESQTQALLAAVRSDSPDMVVELLDRNASLPRQDCFRWAAFGGNNKILEMLNGRGIMDKARNDALYIAADGELEDTVRLLLELGADANATGKTYGSALCAACYDGTEAIVKMLVEKGADVNGPGGDYGAPLQAACAQGNGDVVHYLLEQNVNPNSTLSGEYGSALHACATHGFTELAGKLIDYGAEIDASRDDYGTPLWDAAINRQPGMINLLVRRGANVNFRHPTKYDNQTILMIAGLSAPTDIVRLLLFRGADVHARDNFQQTALMFCANAGSPETTNYLLEAGVEINAQSFDGSTALIEAAESGDVEACRVLLQNGADPKLVADDKRGTALHQACWDDNIDMVDLLLESGADINALAGRWGHVLQAAVLRGNTAFAEKLIDAGADINAVGGFYQTALAAAAYVGDTEIVEMLLGRGADPAIQGGYCGSALASAAAAGQTNSMLALLDVTPRQLWTDALHQAVHNGARDAIRLLLSRGVRVTTPGTRYMSAFDALDAIWVEADLNSDDVDLFRQSADPEGGENADQDDESINDQSDENDYDSAEDFDDFSDGENGTEDGPSVEPNEDDVGGEDEEPEDDERLPHAEIDGQLDGDEEEERRRQLNPDDREEPPAKSLRPFSDEIYDETRTLLLETADRDRSESAPLPGGQEVGQNITLAYGSDAAQSPLPHGAVSPHPYQQSSNNYISKKSSVHEDEDAEETNESRIFEGGIANDYFEDEPADVDDELLDEPEPYEREEETDQDYGDSE